MNPTRHDDWRRNAKLARFFSEIERLGGSQQVEVTIRALSDMKAALAKNVASTPDVYRPEGDEQPTDKIMDYVSEQYVKKLAADLRHKSGYIQVCGLWVHRSIVTFLVYGMLAAIALTLFIPMIFSPRPGGFSRGLIGLLATVGVGLAIFVRTRN